ncbi:centromere protein U isoform X2 [Rhinoderma darwinii]
MSKHKNKSKNLNQLLKGPKGQDVRNQGPGSKTDAENVALIRMKQIMSKKVTSQLLKEILVDSDISILKKSADALQEDIGEDCFNPPLHSTAVYTDEDDELLQTNDNPDLIPAKLMSPIPPVVQEKSTRPTHKESKSKAASNTEHKPDTAKPKRTPQKKALQVPAAGSSKKHGTARNLVDEAPPSPQAPNTTPNISVVSPGKAKTQRKKTNTSIKKKSRKDRMETAPADIWSPENVPKSVRNVNELDVVLFECGKLVELYRENVDADVCKRAIDDFFHSFKEQLATTILDVQKMKDLKRKNAKMQLQIGKKRRRLLEVKNEIIVKQPKLNQLQKECSELEEKQESLKSARAFLDNIAHLQQDYMKFKAENPHIKETYGTSSLPAMCLEAENIMKAEQHFRIVNKQLQSFIDQEKEDA